MSFKKANKHVDRVVLSFQGGSGSGKTYSALNIAKYLCPPGKRIAFIDTEKSAHLYSDIFDFDIDDNFGEFGKLNYSPDVFTAKLKAAATTGEYGVVVIDSATHMWKGEGGFLSMIDNIVRTAKARGGKADSHGAWKEVDPLYAKWMNNLRHLPFHVMLCMRAKQAYEKVEGANGKGSIKKVGVEPEFRDGFEYDVDAQFALDEDHVLVAKKHRLGTFLDGKVFKNPGEDVAEAIKAWCASGAPGAAPADAPAPQVQSPAPVATKPPVKAAPPPPPPPVEEPPPVSEVPDALPEVDPIQSFKDGIASATGLGDLKTVADQISAAKKDKGLSESDYKALSALYAAKAKELKGKAA